MNATVLLSDLLAGNGMIHVIDKIMWHVEDYHETSSVSCLVSNFLHYQSLLVFSLTFYEDLLKKDSWDHIQSPALVCELIGHYMAEF